MAAIHTAALQSTWTHWHRHIVALGITAAAILALFAHDAAHMVTIWWTASTFDHCLLIVPIIGWLVWQRMPALASRTPSVWPSATLWIGAGATSWLLGDAAGIALLRHAGLIVMLQGSVALLLGRDVVRVLLFPLFYALFLVPAGEELVPALQGLTARLSMALLAVVGIPAHIEGVFISTPGGYFEVAEACSGVKFLVAMLALAVLICSLCFRSWRRRIAFVAIALVVPVFANGVRAFATIWVASRTSNEIASGFDHIVYGWFFFAAVIAAVIAAAWRFFDRPADDFVVVEHAARSPSEHRSVATACALAVIIAAAPPVWSLTTSARARAMILPSFAAPVVPDWSMVSRSAADWTPRFDGADRLVAQRYRNAVGQQVDLVVAIYAWQAEGRELVGYGQGAAPPGSGWSWSESLPAHAGTRADRIISNGDARDVISIYRVGEVSTGSVSAVKLATLKARLLGNRQSAAAVLISGPAATRMATDDFMNKLGSIRVLADRAMGR